LKVEWYGKSEAFQSRPDVPVARGLPKDFLPSWQKEVCVMLRKYLLCAATACVALSLVAGTSLAATISYNHVAMTNSYSDSLWNTAGGQAGDSVLASPSSTDYATGLIATVPETQLKSSFNDVSRLTNGAIGTANGTAEATSVLFADGSNQERLLFDLGSSVNVGQFNVYSGHPGATSTRSQQKYVLYGSNSYTATDFTEATSTDSTAAAADGWTAIAFVSTGTNDFNGWVGSSVSDVGTYRYLLYSEIPVNGLNHPFVMEMDVVKAVPEPSTLALLAGGLLGLIAYAWRKRK
jgi:hypothetical protein